MAPAPSWRAAQHPAGLVSLPRGEKIPRAKPALTVATSDGRILLRSPQWWPCCRGLPEARPDRLHPKGLIRPGPYVAGTIQWTLTRTGEERANISYVANLVDPADAWVRLIYTSTTRAIGAKLDSDYRVRLETTQPHFGGLRWWFLCPITGRRVGVLYLPGKGGTVFASRQASGLAYRSQRASPEDRAVERSAKARRSLALQTRTCWTCRTARGSNGCGAARINGSWG